MTDIVWLQVCTALLGGGAAGSIITALVTARRTRIQPVGYRIDVIEMFGKLKGPSSLNVQVVVLSEDKTYIFDNLYEVRVTIFNKGNVDRTKFTFGITLPPGHNPVLLETETRDRHHVFTKAPLISPPAVEGALDFEVTPFNRGDSYSFTIYINADRMAGNIGQMEFSSPDAVVFSASPKAMELLEQIATSASMADTLSRLISRWFHG